MGLLYYIIYRSLEFDRRLLQFGQLIFILLQTTIILGYSKVILSKLYKIDLNNDNNSFAYIFASVCAILIAVNYYFYFREAGTKRIAKKYTYKYKFIDRHPDISLFLFLILPQITLMMFLVILA
jgi:hypothetical protein